MIQPYLFNINNFLGNNSGYAYPSGCMYITLCNGSIAPFVPVLNMPIFMLPFNLLRGGFSNFNPFSGWGMSSMSFTPSASSSSAATPVSASTSQGYQSGTLSSLKNASIFKGVPQSRRDAILSIVDRAAKKYNVDPKLILAIMYNESRFNPKAKSHCGAMGLMQLMPATAKHYGAADPYNMEQNIFAGTKFIAELSKRYKGNITLIAAAYNAGPGNVKNSVPKKRETQTYVARVNSTYRSIA
ncbi:lytic transglycosylase domain-containing protein [bacterium]|nr:lytic transglycosylase domain-containing protein [bacterium]